MLQPQAAGQPDRVQQAAGDCAEGAIRLLGDQAAGILKVGSGLLLHPIMLTQG